MEQVGDFKERLTVALSCAKPAEEVGRLLYDFEDSLLGCKSMPDPQFDFVVFFIDNVPALRLDCAAHLFMALHVEFYLLSREQVRRLIDVVRSGSYVLRGSEPAAVACADMFARNLDPHEADMLFREAERVGSLAFSSFGRELLRVRRLRST